MHDLKRSITFHSTLGFSERRRCHEPQRIKRECSKGGLFIALANPPPLFDNIAAHPSWPSFRRRVLESTSLSALLPPLPCGDILTPRSGRSKWSLLLDPLVLIPRRATGSGQHPRHTLLALHSRLSLPGCRGVPPPTQWRRSRNQMHPWYMKCSLLSDPLSANPTLPC